MAVTQFAFGVVNADIPAMFDTGITFEIKVPSGSSSATTAAATASQTHCRVATDTAVYVAFGSAPTASATAGFFVPANAVEYFRVATGDKAAVVTI